MTDTTNTPAFDPADIAEFEDDRPLDREADRLLSEDRPFAPRSLRSAVREDARSGRSWAENRVAAARERIREKPMKALAYGVGIGLILGVYLRR